jgi:hypothetical protein
MSHRRGKVRFLDDPRRRLEPTHDRLSIRPRREVGTRPTPLTVTRSLRTSSLSKHASRADSCVVQLRDPLGSRLRSA